VLGAGVGLGGVHAGLTVASFASSFPVSARITPAGEGVVPLDQNKLAAGNTCVARPQYPQSLYATALHLGEDGHPRQLGSTTSDAAKGIATPDWMVRNCSECADGVSLGFASEGRGTHRRERLVGR
jgi:hypothetical protein